jgi:hypothetical protein
MVGAFTAFILDRFALRDSVRKIDTGGEALELRRIQLSYDPHRILTLYREARMHHAVGELA